MKDQDRVVHEAFEESSRLPASAAEAGAAAGFTWESLREKLAQATGRRYWRSLDELADSEGFRAFLEAEFPREASLLDTLGRRQFLQLMGASLGLAGLSACTKQPLERIYPYVKPPEEVIPGRPLFFATTLPLAGVGRGVLVESHMGRPTKVEGNPDHPASLGATDIYAQADILNLYDPDRSQTPRFAGVIRPWSAFVAVAQATYEQQKAKRGAGLRILSESITSPSLASMFEKLLQELPEARWHRYEPVNRDAVRGGTRRAFGEALDPVYRLEQAQVVVSIEADLLGSGPGSVRYAREFARGRRVDGNAAPTMSRWYAVEAVPTITGASADHRLALPPSEVEGFVRALAAALGLAVQPPAGAQKYAGWVQAVAKDLKAHRGRSLVVAGEVLSPSAHALVWAMNAALGNLGQTVEFIEPVEARSDEPHLESLAALVADMQAGKVEVLLILGANPVYTAPADLGFAAALEKVPLRIHWGLYQDETALLCHWHVPAAHVLESWGDLRAYDGTVSLIQPLIAPLYEGKTAYEMLAAFSSQPSRSAYDIVRDYWKGVWGEAGFEERWRRALHDGVVAGSTPERKTVSLRPEAVQGLAPLPSAQGLELVVRPDPTVYDGRYANNGWLQELPKPLTKLTWDNAAYVAPSTAERLGLQNGDLVEIRVEERTVRAPVWIQPGQAADTVAVHLGYGRTQAGRVGNGLGFNAYALCSARAFWSARGAELRKVGRGYRFACTQDHFSLEGRDILRKGTLEEYRKDPSLAPHHHGSEAHGELPSFYPGFRYDGYAWGMAIDLNACIGCGACTIACVAENNIAVVGKDQVARGREMHWIRVDRYYEGDWEAPEFVHQPVPCQQCENAPCELVCPVNATVHSAEGLNDMVYNRCVGTKYCSNNCPYKVRRFNFYLYQDWYTESLKAMRNPDVTVRSRGVMEKCTYCVQRINEARIAAKREGRQIRDGEIVTACQQVCPTEAIVFGNINDRQSRVAQLRALPRNYQLLAELNTRPRTTYLAAVRNPNPELSSGKGHA